MRPGYDFAAEYNLYRTTNGVTAIEDLHLATISASLVNKDGTYELINDTAQSSSASGADWTNGPVVVEFSRTANANVPRGEAWIELSVYLSGKKLAYPPLPVFVEPGFNTATT